MAVSIRQARISDAADIGRLTVQLGYELEESVAADRLSRILPRPDQQFLIAELNARVVGWVHAAVAELVEAGAFVVISGLVVDRDQRRRGIGRMLMAEAEAWAKGRGCSIVRLWSSAGRTAAHRFYEQLGYANVKTQYSFVRSLGEDRPRAWREFVPRIQE